MNDKVIIIVPLNPRVTKVQEKLENLKLIEEKKLFKEL